MDRYSRSEGRQQFYDAGLKLQESVYTYNYGDEWRFTVIIESVTPEAPTKMGLIA